MDTIYKVRDPSGAIREIRGPAGASDEDVITQALVLFGEAPSAKVETAANMPISVDSLRANIDAMKIPQETLTDKVALKADAILKSLGSTAPDFLPNRQNLVNLAGGMVPGFLENSDRVKNTTTNDEWKTAGKFLRPAENLLGMRAFQAATALPKIAKLAPIYKNIVGGGAAGTVGGGLSGHPLEGAATGAALGAAFRPLEILGGKVVDLTARLRAGSEGQVITYLKEVFGDDTHKVANALDSLKRLLPFEKPTAGMAAPSINSAKLAALESGAETRPYAADAFAARRMGNREARESALARRAAPLEALEASRTAASSPWYEKSKRELVPVDNELGKILGGVDVDSVMNKVLSSMQQGQTNAAVAGRNAIPTRVQGGAAPITDFAVEFGGVPQGPTASTMSIDALQRLKAALDGEINSASRNMRSPLGLDNLNLNQLKEARGQLINWMNDASESWARGRTTHAAMSPPINEAKLFQTLKGKINAPVAAEGVSQMNTAINNLPSVFKTSTGLNRFNTPEEVIASLSPLGRRTLSGVQSSIEREAAAKALGSNQGVLPKMQGPLDTVESVTPPVLQTVVTLMRRAASLGGKTMDAKAQAILDNAMLNPPVLAQMLREVPPGERSQVIAWLKQNKPGLMGADIGVMTGLLSGANTSSPRHSGLLNPQEQ